MWPKTSAFKLHRFHVMLFCVHRKIARCGLDLVAIFLKFRMWNKGVSQPWTSHQRPCRLFDYCKFAVKKQMRCDHEKEVTKLDANSGSSTRNSTKRRSGTCEHVWRWFAHKAEQPRYSAYATLHYWRTIDLSHVLTMINGSTASSSHSFMFSC